MAFGDFTVDRNNKKYVLGSSGTIVQYLEDQPAFEFNADGSYKGLLVETAATNKCTHSVSISTTQVNNRPYAIIGTGISSKVDNDAVAPDGTTTATKINPLDLLSYNGVVYQGIVQLTDVFSFFVKSAGTEIIHGQTGSGDPWTLNIVTGTVVSLDARYKSLSAQYYGNGWWRVSIALGTQQAGQLIFINASDSLDGFWLWGFQCETSPIATSYIPTSGGTASRVEDDINLTSASSLIGQTEGTLYVEVYWQKSAVDQYLLAVNDGTNNNRFVIYRHNGDDQVKMLARVSGSGVLDQGIDSSGFSGIQKVAFAYANGDQELYRNGSSVATGTASLAGLATLTDVDLGQSFFTTVQANMHIRAAAVFTRRLSGAEAEALTTL